MPLPMPERGISRQEFEIERFDAGVIERSGRAGGVTLGEPLWQATWSLSANLTRDASDEWRAFLTRLRGIQRPFYALDRDRLYPRAYPKGFTRMTTVAGAPFLGAAASWSQVIDDEGEATLSLTDLPSGLILGRGDYVGFKWDAEGSPTGTFDRRALVRVQVPTMVAGNGSVAAIIEPAVPGAVPAGAVAHLDRPACLMRLVPGQSQLGELDRRLKIGGGKIVATQDLRP